MEILNLCFHCSTTITTVTSFLKGYHVYIYMYTCIIIWILHFVEQALPLWDISAIQMFSDEAIQCTEVEGGLKKRKICV
jgi:hypothetical protein